MIDVMANPVLLPALLLCEKVVIEEGTRRQTLIGIINEIFVDEFPENYGPAWVYVRAVGVTPSSDMRIEFKVHNAPETLFTGNGRIDPNKPFDESVESIEMSFALPSLPLPDADIYSLSFFLDQKLMATLQIPVRLVAGRNE